MKQLENRKAFISGAAMGMGKGIATVFVEKGAEVYIADIDEKIFEVARELGPMAHAYILDVSDEEMVKKVTDQVIEDAGRIDILVNNAGIMRPNDVMEMSSENRDLQYRVNVCGCWNCTRAFMPRMIEQGYGRIVNQSSVTGPRVSDPGMMAYSMTKGAILALTHAMAVEGAPYNVTVNAMMPGYIDTPMVHRTARLTRPDDPQSWMDDLAKTLPMGRLGSPREVGYLAAWLASEECSYVTGAEIVIAGANGMVETQPALLV